MKRLGRFLMAALKVTLGFFVWLFRAVFKWWMKEEETKTVRKQPWKAGKRIRSRTRARDLIR